MDFGFFFPYYYYLLKKNYLRIEFQLTGVYEDKRDYQNKKKTKRKK